MRVTVKQTTENHMWQQNYCKIYLVNRCQFLSGPTLIKVQFDGKQEKKKECMYEKQFNNQSTYH